MSALFWMLVALGAFVGILISVKGYDWVRAKAEKTGNKIATNVGSVDWEKEFQTAWTDVDAFVREGERYWPHLKKMPLFWIASMFSLCMAVLAIKFGWNRSGGELSLSAIVHILLFVGADVAIPIVALKWDDPSKRWYEAGNRPVFATALLALFTFMSAIVVLGSTSDVAVERAANADADQASAFELRSQIKAKTAIRDAVMTKRLNEGGQSREALEARAAETKAAADREAKRKYCGLRCEELKAEAVKWESLAANARQEEAYNAEIAALTAKLKEAGGVRLDTDPLATAGEAIGIPAETTQTWGLTALGILFAVGTTMLHIVVSDEVKRAAHTEHGRRAEIGNSVLANRGETARYQVPTIAALPAPGSTKETVVVSVAQDPSAVIAASDELRAIDTLFRDCLRENAGTRVNFGMLYNVYAERQKANGIKTFMNSTSFRLALVQYCQLRKIETGASQLVGWKLSVVQKVEEGAA